MKKKCRKNRGSLTMNLAFLAVGAVLVWAILFSSYGNCAVIDQYLLDGGWVPCSTDLDCSPQAIGYYAAESYCLEGTCRIETEVCLDDVWADTDDKTLICRHYDKYYFPDSGKCLTYDECMAQGQTTIMDDLCFAGV